MVEIQLFASMLFYNPHPSTGILVNSMSPIQVCQKEGCKTLKYKTSFSDLNPVCRRLPGAVDCKYDGNSRGCQRVTEFDIEPGKFICL